MIVAPGARDGLHFNEIQGVLYPGWMQESVVLQLTNAWEAQDGDVFLVSQFPIRGLQRVLTCLVEGRSNPWEMGVLDKPAFVEAAACKRGIDDYLQETKTWTGRRCFKTHAFPHLFPCSYPFSGEGRGIRPKILVLVADPRHAHYIWWQVLVGHLLQGLKAANKELGLKDFICGVASQRRSVVGNYIDHCAAWAREASEHPETIRLCRAGRLGSLDKQEVRAELREIAEFLEVSEECASQLAEAIFSRPGNAGISLSRDEIPDLDAIQGGPLVELSAKRLYSFQNVLDSMDGIAQDAWRTMCKELFDSGNAFLANLAQQATQGSSSLPRQALTGCFRGSEAHAAGHCRPCVFNLRGVCKSSAEECLYCHEEGHSKTKRANHRVRKQRKEQHRARTPSPDGMDRMEPYLVPSELRFSNPPIMFLQPPTLTSNLMHFTQCIEVGNNH
eukprot:TRINITY_DN18226_c0_g1_i1.p1 TRINITY_DN18226_c0_g1~~TRINITY_DN18226_c0_g1_i1.p1  ORF type:complete len:445 (+),score=64.25 TRINITY_DN18226_c0_g1_i1:48-1382(+)